jgi:hypothetical protein
VLVGLFALVNWSAFTALTSLSLGVTTAQAPLGLIMLGLVGFLCVLFTVWAISLQASSLAAARRQTRELQAQRDLADKAEASRFTELQGFLTTELARLNQSGLDARAAVNSRFDQLRREQQVALEEAANGISAHLGELEDRLERSHGLAAELDRPPVREHLR